MFTMQTYKKLMYHTVVHTCGYQAFPAKFLKSSTKVNEITMPMVCISDMQMA